MAKVKDERISLMKCIACLCIIILHTFTPSADNTAQEFAYLLGSFGIPLFFLVNGYLLAEKEFTKDFIVKSIKRFLIFMATWGLIVGALFAAKEKSISELFKVIIGEFVGKSHLFQLWFLAALLVLYLILYAAINFRGDCPKTRA